jgi:hypothetical protein
MTELILLTALFTKHFIVDFPLQPRYQYSNKGTYGHMGGVLHAFLHFVPTFAIFWYFFDVESAFVAAWLDAIIHYHIDWAKVNITKKMGWGPTTHEEFWWLVGLDQFLHALTYIGIVAVNVV